MSLPFKHDPPLPAASPSFPPPSQPATSDPSTYGIGNATLRVQQLTQSSPAHLVSPSSPSSGRPTFTPVDSSQSLPQNRDLSPAALPATFLPAAPLEAPPQSLLGFNNLSTISGAGGSGYYVNAATEGVDALTQAHRQFNLTGSPSAQLADPSAATLPTSLTTIDMSPASGWSSRIPQDNAMMRSQNASAGSSSSQPRPGAMMSTSLSSDQHRSEEYGHFVRPNGMPVGAHPHPSMRRANTYDNLPGSSSDHHAHKHYESLQKQDDIMMGDEDDGPEHGQMHGERDPNRPSSGGMGGSAGDKSRWTSSSTSGRPSSAGDAKDVGVVARKQNTACDACRNRKVRCLRTAGEEKCNHCKARGIECTTIYVQLATAGVKRTGKRTRADGAMGDGDAPMAGVGAGEEATNALIRYLLLRDCEYADNVQGLSYVEGPGRRVIPTTPSEARLINATARQEFVSSLLETYFSTVHIRYPVIEPQEFLQRYHYHSPELGGSPPDVIMAVLLAWGAKFSKHPIIVADRRETASEELTPSQRLKRSMKNPLSAATTTQKGEGSSSGMGRSGSNPDLSSRVMGRSRIAEDLIVKAQEVMDRNKAHRTASIDNAKAAMIIQALFWQQAGKTEAEDAISPSQLRSRKRRGVYICNGVWVTCAISHMFEMKVHLQETVERIADAAQRSQVAMSWWLACMFDSHMSAFYRRKPLISMEDYSTEPPAPPTTSPDGGPSPVAAEQGYRIWLNSALDQCEMMRSVYFTLWTPIAQQEGVSARKLEKLVSKAYNWRSNHLALVGAPDPDWPSTWKFADAITACSSDINYQIVWVLMWQAVDEFGIAELKCTNLASYKMASTRHGFNTNLPTSVAEMELDRSKIRGLSDAIYDEALKAALRCADLARMLSDFDYLQNEAGIMKFSLCEAGYCLTRFKRPEVYKIIDGLRQYGQAFEECYEQADELERLASEYTHPRVGDSQSHEIAASHAQVSTTSYNAVRSQPTRRRESIVAQDTEYGTAGKGDGGPLPAMSTRMDDHIGPDPGAAQFGAPRYGQHPMRGSMQSQESQHQQRHQQQQPPYHTHHHQAPSHHHQQEQHHHAQSQSYPPHQAQHYGNATPHNSMYAQGSGGGGSGGGAGGSSSAAYGGRPHSSSFGYPNGPARHNSAGSGGNAGYHQGQSGGSGGGKEGSQYF